MAVIDGFVVVYFIGESLQCRYIGCRSRMQKDIC